MNIRIMLGMLNKLSHLRSHEHWTHQQLKDHQTQALHRLREYTYKHSPFYQQFHQGLWDKPLQDLPVLTKAMMMEHFDDLVTEQTLRLQDIEAFIATSHGEQYLQRYWVNATSGSTGRPGIFLFDRAEWTTVIASFARAYEWAGVKVNLARRRKMAVVASASPWHMSALVGATVRSWWSPTLRISASEPLPEIVQKLNEWQPEVLVAYASMGRFLADEQIAGRLQIQPNAILTSSEVLTDEARQHIEAVWGRRLFNHYGATECGGIAAECDLHAGMHLYEDLVIFEVVDKNNQPVPPGVYGEKMLITVLFNRTQPLIRYELSDSVRLAVQPCLSGRPFHLVDSVQGRTEDILHFPALVGGELAIHPNVFHHIMDKVRAEGWQIIHDETGLTVLLSTVSQDFDTEALHTDLRKALASRGVLTPPIHLQLVDEIPKSASGKSPLIKSTLVHS
jgi:phenylacetate-CoA ligase